MTWQLTHILGSLDRYDVPSAYQNVNPPVPIATPTATHASTASVVTPGRRSRRRENFRDMPGCYNFPAVERIELLDRVRGIFTFRARPRGRRRRPARAWAAERRRP